jgi:hypothetical protein
MPWRHGLERSEEERLTRTHRRAVLSRPDSAGGDKLLAFRIAVTE